MAQSSVDVGFTTSVDRNSSMDECDFSAKTSIETRPINEDSSDDGDVEISMFKRKKRIQRFADDLSDSVEDDARIGDKSTFNDKGVIVPSEQTLQDDSSSSDIIFNNHAKKSRIRNISNKDDSDSDSLPTSTKVALKNKEQQARMTNKRHKLQDKFKSLINCREKDNEKFNKDSETDNDSKSHDDQTENQSDNSDEEGSSIEKLKQVGTVYQTREKAQCALMRESL